MKEIFKVFLLCLLILIFGDVKAQTQTSGMTMAMNGYIVNLGGKIFFQPCEDSTKTVWQSLDGRSFALWYFREDLYLDAVDSVGDSSIINFHEKEDKKSYVTTMRYFYCSLEVDMMLLDTARFQIFSMPGFTLSYGKNQYPLEGFRIDNRVKKILPSQVKNVRSIYNYYYNRGYAVPIWLDDYIDKLIEARGARK